MRFFLNRQHEAAILLFHFGIRTWNFMFSGFSENKLSIHFLLNPSQLPQAFEGKVALTHILSFSQTITVITTLNESQVYTFYTISFYDSHQKLSNLTALQHGGHLLWILQSSTDLSASLCINTGLDPGTPAAFRVSCQEHYRAECCLQKSINGFSTRDLLWRVILHTGMLAGFYLMPFILLCPSDTEVLYVNHVGFTPLPFAAVFLR